MNDIDSSLPTLSQMGTQNDNDALKELASRLEQQSRLFEQIASATPDFIYVFDLNGRFLYANRRLLEVWGTTFEQAVGKNLYELGYPQWHADMHMRELRQVIETKHPIKGEVPFTGGSGISGIYEYIFTPVLGPDGNVEVIAGTTRDVTDRHRSEQEAREAKAAAETTLASWQAVVANMVEGVILVDGLGNMLDWNQAALEMHGYSRVEDVRRNLSTFVDTYQMFDPDGQLLPLDQWPVPRMLRGESFRNMEVRVRRLDRPIERIISYSGTPLRDQDGTIKLVLLTLHDMTDERMAQRALQESEARFREIFEQTPIGLTLTDLQGRYLHVNPAYCRIVGYTREQLLDPNMDFRTLIHPEDRPLMLEKMSQLLSGQIPAFFIEKRYVRPDRQIVWVRVTGTVRRDPDGKPIQFVRLVENITARKLAEEAMRRSREQLELVVKGANVGVWYCPLPFDKLIWDDKVKEHFHLPPDAEVTIETFYERLHPDDRERTRTAIETSIGQRKPYDIEYRTVSPDGQSVKWIRASGRGFYDQNGQPTRFDGITIDITERLRIEEQVREESNAIATINRVGQTLSGELELDKLVQTVTDATTQLTGAEFGAFFYNVVNEEGESYVLYTISGVPRENFDKFPKPRNTEIFGPTFRGEGIVRLDDVTADPRYGRNAPYFGMPKGHLPVRSYLAVPVISRSGEVLGGLFYGHSRPGVFTERAEQIVSGIAAQAAVAIDNARLFNDVRRANDEKDKLLESERAARSEAERASRMKDEFLATLSHELRTPLNAILGWSQILGSGARNEEDLEEGLKTIERNARAQTQIIEDLLDMSRIISGKIRLDVQRIELSPVVQAALDTVKPAAEAKGVRLHAVLDPLASPVSGDPNRLQQVFWNLLNNAVKFTPRGGRVQVLLERVNSHLEVSVTDTGEGISPEFLPYVFDRFSQSDASTTRRHGGLGLGLAIVKQLVELHGGTVRAKSPGPGQGATFTVALPLTVLHPEPEPAEDRRHPAAGGGPLLPDTCRRLGGVKVLVVDDEADARALVRRVLEDCDAVVTLAGSAAEAFKLFKETRPNVIVSDIGMPGEDGYSLIRRIRELGPEQGGNTPAVALTAYARSEDRMRAVMAGFQHHVAKPVEPAELLTMVASLASA